MTATGYAVVLDGEIVVRTVSPDQQGAMVNGLLVIFGVMALDHWTNEAIERLWQTEIAATNAGGPRIAVAQVAILPRP